MDATLFTRHAKKEKPLASFTLVELLTVIAIIAILAALTLAAAQGVMTQAARSRAKTEIQAMSTALEGYKTDNGAYPSTHTFSSTNAYTQSSGSEYQGSSQLLYQALSGYANYYDTAVAGTRSYMTFKTAQLGGYKSGTGPTYIQDPWRNPYGYYTGDTASPQLNPPISGTGFFDLWSTGGTAQNGSIATNAWLVSWQ
jgi:prepilin-type N-terminal cleavage/methylation domain-containing protein